MLFENIKHYTYITCKLLLLVLLINKFSFRTGPGSENFEINSTTAVITTRHNSSLDREKNDTYHLTLIASDGGNKTTSVPLVVKITDVNDERPRFSQQVYYANISEDAARNTIVRRVTATDLDFLDLNKEIIYTSTGADAKFYINRATGRSMFTGRFLNQTKGNQRFQPHYLYRAKWR